MKRFLAVILALIFLVFIGCENSKTKTKVNTAELKTPFETAEGLFKQDKYEESKVILLKLYKENPDHATMICFYLFMDYGMQGDYKKAALFLDNALSQTMIHETLKEARNNPKYINVFKDESIRKTVDAILKADPAE